MGARVVEGSGLLSRQRPRSFQGSNPCPSVALPGCTELGRTPGRDAARFRKQADRKEGLCADNPHGTGNGRSL